MVGFKADPGCCVLSVLRPSSCAPACPAPAPRSAAAPSAPCAARRDGARVQARDSSQGFPAATLPCWGGQRQPRAPAALPSPCSPVAAWRAAAGEGRAPTGWAPWASWTPRCRWLSLSPPWGRSCCWSWCPSRNGNWGKEPWGVKRIRVRQERSPVLGLGMMKSLLGQCQAQVPELGHPELWLRSWCP